MRHVPNKTLHTDRGANSRQKQKETNLRKILSEYSPFFCEPAPSKKKVMIESCGVFEISVFIILHLVCQSALRGTDKELVGHCCRRCSCGIHGARFIQPSCLTDAKVQKNPTWSTKCCFFTANHPKNPRLMCKGLKAAFKPKKLVFPSNLSNIASVRKKKAGLLATTT